MKLRHKWHKIAAGLLATSLIFSSLVFTTGAEGTDDTISDNKILHYDFVGVESTIVPDASGNGKAGVIRNYDEGGTEIVDVNVYGRDLKALSLPGGSSGGYLELPAAILSGLESMTVSCWVNINDNVNYQRIWDFGTGTTTYLYLLTDGQNDGATGYTAAITNGGWSQEQPASKASTLETGKWILTTVVFDGANDKLILYEDGLEVASQDITVDLSALAASSNNYIGNGQFSGDAKTGGLFADFAIYDYAMTAGEVAGMFGVEDDDLAQSDLAGIDLGDLLSVTSDLSLPLAGSSGSVITWSSSDESVIDNEGAVTRPAAGNPDASIVLTASAMYGTMTEPVTRAFTVIVPAMPSDQDVVEYDLEHLNPGNMTAVSADLVLPTSGAQGSVITWSSSNEDLIQTDGQVIRPPTDMDPMSVTLTAAATYGTAQATRDFTAVVMPQYEVLEIIRVEPISVETYVGHSPNLPNYVEVTYSNNQTLPAKAVWPALIDSSKYAAEGTFAIDGHLIEDDYPIQASVEVVSGESSAIDKQVSSFDLNDVSVFGDTIFSQNQERTVDYLKLLDNDRMLYNFRMTYGQDTLGAQALGGWDAPTGLLRGHSTGHYLSALALGYASTGDAELKADLDYMIAELRKLQQMSAGDPAAFESAGTSQSVWSTDPTEWGTGFISAYSPDQFALLEIYTPYATIWAPYYTLHKIMAGFIDAYVYAGNETALEAAEDLGDWIYYRLSACTPEQLTKMWDMYIAGEYGGMNESLARLYNITEEQRYLDAAKLFDNTTFFDNLAENVDDITTRHANQHIPQIVGAMAEYEASGDTYYYDLAKNFWEMSVGRYAYSIGGVGRGENYRVPYELAGQIDSDKNCETCASYNKLKLTKELAQYDPDNAAYMDYYEQTLINHILASQNPVTSDSMHHGTTYMLPIGPGTQKTYGGDYNSFTCCHGTGMENHVKYQEAAYFKSENALYVNLYLPSQLNWEEKGITITQDTAFPSETSTLTITGATAAFDLKLRVPYWATEGFFVEINGEPVALEAEPSSFVTISDTWQDGDVITLRMPYTMHLAKTPDQYQDMPAASIMYGPLVMVAKSNSTNWLSLDLAPDLSSSIAVEEISGTPVLNTNNLELVPMYQAHHFRYHTYFMINMLEAGDTHPWYQVSATANNSEYGVVIADKEIVPQGRPVEFTVNPAAGYKVQHVSVNGTAVELTDSKYLIESAQEDVAMVVAFVADGSSVPTDPTDPTYPTDPTDPTPTPIPSDPTDPTGPTDPTPTPTPSDPTDSTPTPTPSDPTDSTEPTEPTDLTPTPVPTSDESESGRISVDAETNMQAAATADEGAFAGDVVIGIKKISNDSDQGRQAMALIAEKYPNLDNLMLFDISAMLQDGGTSVQPASGKSVRITMKLPAGIDADRAVVAHIKADGTVELLESKVENGFISFETTGFSVFALAETAEQASDEIIKTGEGDDTRITYIMMILVLLTFVIMTRRYSIRRQS